jgi:hypothetical protein
VACFYADAKAEAEHWVGEGRWEREKDQKSRFRVSQRSVPKICNKFIKKTFCAIWDIMSAKLKSAINYFC